VTLSELSVLSRLDREGPATPGALASLLRGRRYFHEEREPSRPAQPAQVRRIAR
jgi:hypothetical protein